MQLNNTVKTIKNKFDSFVLKIIHRQNSYFKEEIKKQNYNSHSDNKHYETHKNIISISPGGFKGFYMFGTCSYISENYNLTNYSFSGASAGAWNALFMTCKKDTREFKKDLLKTDFKKFKSIREIEVAIKNKILSNYTSADFELDRLYIGITTVHNFKIKTVIATNFESLEDAIDCCISSSHIPYITGGFFNKYKNMISFDGGFSSYPYIRSIHNVLHITPSMWTIKKRLHECRTLYDITSLFSKNNLNVQELFDKGYEDAKKNKDRLDQIFSESHFSNISTGISGNNTCDSQKYLQNAH